MKLLLRRDQRKAGMLGDRAMFVLEVRAQLSDEERAAIKRASLTDNILFQRFAHPPAGDTLNDKWDNFRLEAMNVEIRVGELVDGRRFECRSIREMMSAEKSIRKAGELFAMVLWRAMHFDGEEVIDYEESEANWASWMIS
jgi:hypothetical protein